ncbi:MAG: hypothetical protein GY838_02130 [bacterium]|nr:hypothetical protein [bacterium]
MFPEIKTFDCFVRVPGWRLYLALMAVNETRERGTVLDVAARGAGAELHRAHPAGSLVADATITAIRKSIKRLGLDPAASPPCSELLLRRFLASSVVPRGSLAWEYLAVLTIKSHAPWIALDRAALEPPLMFRTGEAGETLSWADGELDCAGLPVLTDRRGVVGSPWSHPAPDDLQDAGETVFVCCLPEELFRRIDPKTFLGRANWLTWAYRFLFMRTCKFRAD